MKQAFEALTSVVGDNGQPLVDTQGVEPSDIKVWRTLLSGLDEEMVVWKRTFSKAYGTKAHVAKLTEDDENERVEIDPYADADED